MTCSFSLSDENMFRSFGFLSTKHVAKRSLFRSPANKNIMKYVKLPLIYQKIFS